MSNSPRKPRPSAVKKAVARKEQKAIPDRLLWNLILVEVIFTMSDRPDDGAQILKIQFPEKTDFTTFPAHRIQTLMNTGAFKVRQGFPVERQQYFQAHDVFLLNISPLGKMTDAEFWKGHEDVPAPTEPEAEQQPVALPAGNELTASLGAAIAADATAPADNVLQFKPVEPTATDEL